MEEQEIKAYKKSIKKNYNWVGGGMLFQFLIVMGGGMIPSFIMGILYRLGMISQSSMMGLLQSSGYIITLNGVCYLIGNTVAYLSGLAGTRGFKDGKKFWQSSREKKSNLLLYALIALSLQGISIIIQNITAYLLHSNGGGLIDLSVYSFGESLYSNTILVIYFVIIAPVTEEMLLRGMALRNLSVISPSFGIIASAIMFGLMHANLLQSIIGIVTGLFLGTITVKCKSIRPAILCHMTINANAMLLSFLGYKFGDGLKAEYVIVYFSILIVLGILALVSLMRKQMGIFQVAKTEQEKKQYTWPLFLTSPTCIAFMVMYLGIIIAGIIM